MTTTHMNTHFTILGSCRAGCNLVDKERKEQEKEVRTSGQCLGHIIWSWITGNIHKIM